MVKAAGIYNYHSALKGLPIQVILHAGVKVVEPGSRAV
jgi:hypothetical protein